MSSTALTPQHTTQPSFDAGTLIGTGGAKYGQPCSYYEQWGVLHKTCCDGPCAYQPLGATAQGVRPTLSTKVPPSFYAGQPQDASVATLTKGASCNAPLQAFANQAGTGCGVPLSHYASGYTGQPIPPPLAPIMPPLVTLDGLGPSNTDVVLGRTAQTNCDGCLVGASDLFDGQVPMFSAMKPFTAPVEGTLLPTDSQPPFLDWSGKPRQLVQPMSASGSSSAQTIGIWVIVIILLGLGGWFLWKNYAQ